MRSYCWWTEWFLGSPAQWVNTGGGGWAGWTRWALSWNILETVLVGDQEYILGDWDWEWFKRDYYLSVDAGAHHVSSNRVVANNVVGQHSILIFRIIILINIVINIQCWSTFHSAFQYHDYSDQYSNQYSMLPSIPFWSRILRLLF